MTNKKLKQQILNEYKEIAKTPSDEVWERFENHMNTADKLRSKKPTKLFIKILVATVAILLLATAVAAAFGYNLVDMFFSALNSPDGTSIDFNSGNELSIIYNTRDYDSINELLECENLNILYPAELPHGYSFTNFNVHETNSGLWINLYATEPYITFSVEIGVNHQINRYAHKTNDIEYNVFESVNGMQQASFNYNDNYYTIIVSDRAMLSKIINKLKKSE
jgi:hypothetical protein